MSSMREEFERGHAEREVESTLLEILVVEHRAMYTRLLVLDVSGRVLLTCLAVGGAFAARASAFATTAALLAACLLATAWYWGRRTARLRIGRISQALSNYTRGSAAQHAYAESRFSLDFRSPFDVLLRLEPLLWVCVVAMVVIGGLLSHS